ncbi:class II aldolase/adducin family protein [Actinomadura mexicana]|uniref:Class II Aldolase and Adducin N-terminal domain-containing protein n=1 Tax=Actinomadura mexicana TaxID=134959 RepID=A0A239C4C9_9ACTN|nr:class II aldolase/adducin family protein [Actinomadura mexicana]SNS14274.1 Class II Aldolase and Adducin N-terminal domain-containing protein [Actinomadura mexicana]
MVAEAIGDRNALLLHRHGLVTTGPDVPTAVMTAIFLEKACRLQLQVAAATGTYDHSDEAEALARRARCYGPSQLESAWAYLVRRLPRGPERREVLPP